jgi:hypothetical protein
VTFITCIQKKNLIGAQKIKIKIKIKIMHLFFFGGEKKHPYPFFILFQKKNATYP